MFRSIVASWIQNSLTRKQKANMNVNRNQLYKNHEQKKLIAVMYKKTSTGESFMTVISWSSWKKKISTDRNVPTSVKN